MIKELFINWINNLTEKYIDSIDLSSPVNIILLMVIVGLVFCIYKTGNVYNSGVEPMMKPAQPHCLCFDLHFWQNTGHFF